MLGGGVTSFISEYISVLPSHTGASPDIQSGGRGSEIIVERGVRKAPVCFRCSMYGPLGPGSDF